MNFKNLLLLLYATLSCLSVSQAQDATPTPALISGQSSTPVSSFDLEVPPSKSCGSSCAPNAAKIIIDRINAALQQKGLSATQKRGFNWVFLIQGANYSSVGDARLTERREALNLVLQRLIETRKTWKDSEIGDTLNVLRYQFVLEDLPKNAAQSSLLNFRGQDGLSSLVTPVATPIAGKYPDGQRYLDGHDWHRAVVSAKEELSKTNLKWDNTVLVVLDWNSLNQAPKTTKAGLNQGGSPALMMTEAEFSKKFDEETAAGQTSGLTDFRPGAYNYSIGVFLSKNPVPIADGVTPTGVPTGSVGSTPAVTTQTTPASSSLNPGVVLVFLLVALCGGAGFLYWKNQTASADILVDSSRFSLSLREKPSIEIHGPNGTSNRSAHVLSQDQAPLAPDGKLAEIRILPGGKIQVTRGACGLKRISGEAQGSNDALTLGNGPTQIALVSGGDTVAQIRIQKRTTQ